MRANLHRNCGRTQLLVSLDIRRAVMVAVDGIVTMRKKSTDCTLVPAAAEGFKPAA